MPRVATGGALDHICSDGPGLLRPNFHNLGVEVGLTARLGRQLFKVSAVDAPALSLFVGISAAVGTSGLRPIPLNVPLGTVQKPDVCRAKRQFFGRYKVENSGELVER